MSAILNLSMYGYGVVRCKKGVISFNTLLGKVFMTEACFGLFLTRVLKLEDVV